MKKTAMALLILGLLQMVADVTGIRALKGIAAATGASPAPKVFGMAGGLETFSSAFFLEWEDSGGNHHQLQITAALYSKLKGPYNRRNVYGAALAYGPVLPDRLRDPIMHFAVSGNAPLLRELGIDPNQIASTIRVRVQPKHQTKPLPLQFEERVR